MHKRNPTSWKPRSALECAINVVTVSAVVLCIAQVVGTAEAIGIHPSAKDGRIVSKEAGNQTICLSLECNRTASIVIKNMDPDVDPCDDFYRFACGGFLKSTIVPDDEDYVNAFTGIKDKLQQQLRASMEEPSGPNDPKPLRLVKTLYKTCIDETAIENQGLEPLYKKLQKLGGWPVLDGQLWNEADFDWINATYKLHDAGYSADNFFHFGINVDWENETRNVLTLETADLGLSYEYLSEGVDNENVKAYYNYMVDIAVLLGAERKPASSELMESLLFEINLANISLSFEERYHALFLHTLMTLDELRNNYPSIPWKEYFRKLLPKNITPEENEVAIVYLPSFISDLEKLLSKTPKRVQANYAIWRAVKDSVKYLNNDIRKRELAYLTAVDQETEMKSRWQECVDLVSNHLSIGVGATYVRKYFNQEAKQYIIDMVTDIKKQLYKIIEQVEWMDDDIRQSSVETVETMSSHVAYPDELLDDAELENFYKNLELSGGSYLDSMLNLTLFDVESSFGKLREPGNRNDWVSIAHPTSIMASYSYYGNNIHLPAGVLQNPFFSIDRPRYMNYANIGFAIGHLTLGAFSYMEQKFDEEGSLSNRSSLKENYSKRVECIIQQYGNYTVEEVGLKLNGIQTRKNNIKDNVAFKEAYLAYNDWAEKNKPEQQLPGLSYSPNQMFWISAANPWCTKWKTEGLERFITREYHSPPEFRILGAVSNMPQFAKDFHCPIGSKMNPEKKCSVW